MNLWQTRQNLLNGLQTNWLSKMLLLIRALNCYIIYDQNGKGIISLSRVWDLYNADLWHKKEKKRG